MITRGWYCKLRGRTRGPVSPAVLRQLASSGKLRPTDMISRDGTTNWIRAGNVKHLFGERGRQAPLAVDHGPAEVYIGPAITTRASKR